MGLDPKNFPPMEVASPCGLLARHFPGDRFLELQQRQKAASDVGVGRPRTGLVYPVTVAGVADPFFKNNFQRSPNPTPRQWQDVTDPLFVNWMVGSAEGQFGLQLPQVVGRRREPGAVQGRLLPADRQPWAHQAWTRRPSTR